MSAKVTKMSDEMVFNMLPIIVAVVIVAFTFVLLKYFLWRVKGNNVIFVGIEGSGKTALYAQLVARKEVQTVTSIQENMTLLSGTSLNIVDVPGNTRLRGQIFSKYVAGVRGVVVVYDSGNFVDNVRECAEVLYEVLLNKDVKKSKCPVLLFCNKQDQDMSRGAEAIRVAVERELTTLSKTANSALSDDSGTQRTLAPVNQTISLDKLSNVVSAVPGCCVGQDSDIGQLESWIVKL